jgi:hypothetical protein
VIRRPAGKKEEFVMTAAGELLNLPVAIPMRPVVPAYQLPQRRAPNRFAQPYRVYRHRQQQPSNSLWYGANAYAVKAPDKGNVIDLFA